VMAPGATAALATASPAVATVNEVPELEPDRGTDARRVPAARGGSATCVRHHFAQVPSVTAGMDDRHKSCAWMPSTRVTRERPDVRQGTTHLATR
jgi:hypothetical protein